MEITLIDSTIVVLLEPTQAARESVKQSEIQAILDPPVTVAQTLDGGLFFTSMRAQLELQVSQRRVEAKDLSGHAVGASKAPQAVVKALKLVRGKPTGVGLNYELETKPSELSSGDYIARNFLAFKRLSQLGDILATSVALQLTSVGTVFKLRIEPRWQKAENPVLFFNVNVHHDVGERTRWVLDPAAVQQRFMKGWEQTCSLINRMIEVG